MLLPVLSTNSGIQIMITREKLSVQFQMKELGELKHFLGAYEGSAISRPTKICQDLLQRDDMPDCKPICIPMDLNVKLKEDEGKELGGWEFYLSHIDSAKYILFNWCR